ncbi:protein of unknown function [Halpernia humi]|uniref:DUF4286 family protein n=1 Tax=Halpernia humi TaxID=493375 RepID=A0A1H5SJD0_9FLAO|nr:DUF4286 family protein [Halpernia humi]SEF50729.1 protein of unknown function [Halpernia humi]
MSILSITFHTPEHLLSDWEKFQENSLENLIENLIQVENYILSDVESEMLHEGKNTNLLLIFEDENLREEFVDSELLNLQHHIEKEFGEDVMVFKTYLNERKSRM